MATFTSTYPLSNPISVLTDKPREEFTREDLIRVIEHKEIERITFHYTAMDGKYKELKIPVASRAQAERIRHNYLVLLLAFGSLTHAQEMRSLALFRDEVMPKLATMNEDVRPVAALARA